VPFDQRRQRASAYFVKRLNIIGKQVIEQARELAYIAGDPSFYLWMTTGFAGRAGGAQRKLAMESWR
jgi:hypothetical protein